MITVFKSWSVLVYYCFVSFINLIYRFSLRSSLNSSPSLYLHSQLLGKRDQLYKSSRNCREQINFINLVNLLNPQWWINFNSNLNIMHSNSFNVSTQNLIHYLLLTFQLFKLTLQTYSHILFKAHSHTFFKSSFSHHRLLENCHYVRLLKKLKSL